MSEYKKALLAVSFGTSYTQVIESCIAPVEQAMAAAAPGYDLFSGLYLRNDYKKTEKCLSHGNFHASGSFRSAGSNGL